MAKTVQVQVPTAAPKPQPQQRQVAASSPVGGFDDLFEDAPEKFTKRLMLSTCGRERTGKTEFALSAPDPIAIVNFDPGLEGVVEKWVRRGKKIKVSYIDIPEKADAQTWLECYKRAKAAYYAALANPKVRTVLVDTWSDLWDLMKLAEFGVLNPAVDIKRAYGPLNQIMRTMVRAAYDTDKNLILTNKMKEVYAKDATGNESGTGKFQRAGWGGTGYLIQSNIEHRYNREKKQFELEIIDCRQNMSVAGFVLTNSECTFDAMMNVVYEE